MEEKGERSRRESRGRENASRQKKKAEADAERKDPGPEETLQPERKEVPEDEQEEHPAPEVTEGKDEKKKPGQERGGSISKPIPEQKKSRGHGRSRSETDPLMMSLAELTKFLEEKAVKRKTRVAQRQRAALLGVLPPGTLPPAKILGRQVPRTESTPGVESRESNLKGPASVTSKTSKAGVPKVQKLRRKNLLEHMEREIEHRGEKSVLFRMVTIASHAEVPNHLLEYHEKRIKEFNIAPDIELLSGLLIVYPKHFLHVLEGSEMVLANYLSDAAHEFEKKPSLHNPEDGEKVLRVHMIILGTFQIDQRFMKKWQGVVTAYPSHSNLMDIVGYQKRLFEFIKRTWTLLIVGRNFIPLLPPIETPNEVSSRQLPSSPSIQPSKQVQKPVTKPIEDDFGLGLAKTMARVAPVDNINDSINELMEESMNLLPSLPILQYFLKDKEHCPKLLTPQQHIDKYWRISNDPSWRDVVWPIPNRLYPYD